MRVYYDADARRIPRRPRRSTLHRGQAPRLAARGRLPPLRRELDLAQADVQGRDLDALVLADQLERLVERLRSGRDQPHQLVRRRRAHVRQLLLLRGVDVQVFRPGVLSDDHPLVDIGAWPDEQRASLLKVEHGEGGDLPGPVGDETAGRARPELAVPGLEPLEDVVEDARAAGLGKELRAKA